MSFINSHSVCHESAERKSSKKYFLILRFGLMSNEPTSNNGDLCKQLIGTTNYEITCKLYSLLEYLLRVIPYSFKDNVSLRKTTFLPFDDTYDLEIEFFNTFLKIALAVNVLSKHSINPTTFI